LVQGLPKFDDPDLLVGPDGYSDAGVYRLDDTTALVQTVDFFPPLVDDPELFGRIAAANSLSDVYAMGGTPKTALNIVGFPDDKLGMEVLAAILRGGAERVKTAGAVIVGGHSVRDTEIKYGLSVTGIVDPRKMLTNRRARPRQALVLTKALGTGFVTTADRARKCDAETLAAACESMAHLNDVASRMAVNVGATAATDITGFGLAGHAFEMAEAADVTIAIEIERLPLLPGAAELARRGFHTRANATNRAHVSGTIGWETDRDHDRAEFLFDPQTSGGLLIAVDPAAAETIVAACHEAGHHHAAVIGTVAERGSTRLVIRE
jgi:selenide,water dikinase